VHYPGQMLAIVIMRKWLSLIPVNITIFRQSTSWVRDNHSLGELPEEGAGEGQRGLVVVPAGGR
jgi:hypothetical protein